MSVFINGWTKASVIEHIKKNFKGKAVDPSSKKCFYLTEDGKKCAVGLFIPDGHPSQLTDYGVESLLQHYPDLHEYMPLNLGGLQMLQDAHDNSLEDECLDRMVGCVSSLKD